MSSITERAHREKEQYNKGINRRVYDNVLSHAKYYYRLRREEVLREQLQYANGRRILEIGSQCWLHWIEDFNIQPDALECINISEKELQKGIKSATTSRVKPHFSLMDANDLQFEDNSFDLVFGDAILHHLDFLKALDEIKRVLRPQGRMVFTEPLGNNPVGKVVRALTPHARTDDEQPLRWKELAEIKQRFDTTFYYEQLLSVPVGIISRFVFPSPENMLMKSTYRVDLFIDSNFPPLRNMYRYVIIVGVDKRSADYVQAVS
jgi:ubiquinone/menaquinone biosynthesis C-methylase UbiE